MAEEHPLKPFYSVLVLAFACSLFVAVAAVGLKPMQETNRTLDQKKNILTAAGIYLPDKPVEPQFEAVETRLINLATGDYVPAEEINQHIAASSTENTTELKRSEDPRSEDPAGIRKLEKYSLIYLLKEDNKISQAVLPVRGKGLWSTMYAYVSLDADLTTIRGISFYEHGETPGLGGEVENPRWLASWKNKKIYSAEGRVAIKVVKDSSREKPEDLIHTIDGLSGATLTSQGVDHLMQFWFGDHGFKPFLDRIKSQGGFNG